MDFIFQISRDQADKSICRWSWVRKHVQRAKEKDKRFPKKEAIRSQDKRGASIKIYVSRIQGGLKTEANSQISYTGMEKKSKQGTAFALLKARGKKENVRWAATEIPRPRTEGRA